MGEERINNAIISSFNLYHINLYLSIKYSCFKYGLRTSKVLDGFKKLLTSP